MFTNPQIGMAVRSARLAAGLSAKSLAERCDLLPSALSKIESGKRSLEFTEAISLCAVLRIRVDHLAALARDVEPIALETASLQEQLKHDLQALQQKLIRQAIAIRSSELAESAV